MANGPMKTVPRRLIPSPLLLALLFEKMEFPRMPLPVLAGMSGTTMIPPANRLWAMILPCPGLVPPTRKPLPRRRRP